MKNIKVIYFEDDMEKFRIIENLLQEFNFQVIRVPRNEESLSKLTALNPDVVLVEHRLSTNVYYHLLFKMDALEKLNRIPKIVITNRNQTYDLLWSPENPFWDYVTDPFTAQEFIERFIYWSKKIKASISCE